MRVLVTGGAGFIGRHVCAELRKHGHEVVAIDKQIPTIAYLRESGLEIHHCDVSNWSYLYWILKNCQIEAVVHLAASVSVADSAANPLDYVRANSEATASFMDFVCKRSPSRISRLVVASSMSIYGEGCPHRPTHEADAALPTSVYGLTKFDQERLCLILAEQAGISTMALRLFNCYGPGQSQTNRLTGVLANWAGDILRGERPRVCEDGQQTRDFVYVRDVARAFRLAVESDARDVVNIGTGQRTTLADAARQLAAAFGRPDIEPMITGESRPGDIRHCAADVRRAAEVLDWRPSTTLADGLRLYAVHERERQQLPSSPLAPTSAPAVA